MSPLWYSQSGGLQFTFCKTVALTRFADGCSRFGFSALDIFFYAAALASVINFVRFFTIIHNSLLTGGHVHLNATHGFVG